MNAAVLMLRANKAKLVFKGVKLALGIWAAGGIVEHARAAYYDKHVKDGIGDKAGEDSGKWLDVREWPDRLVRALRIVRFQVAMLLVLHIIALIVLSKAEHIACQGNHPTACNLAQKTGLHN